MNSGLAGDRSGCLVSNPLSAISLVLKCCEGKRKTTHFGVNSEHILFKLSNFWHVHRLIFIFNERKDT